MLSQLHVTNSALAGAYVVAFGAVLRVWPLPVGWQDYALLLTGMVAALAWFANLRRFRTVADTPTAKIASSPLGLVEWSGHSVRLPGDGLAAPLSGLPCLKEWLLRHFDKDGDGELNNAEWEAARQAALATLRADAAAQPAAGWPMLRRPRDGRLFLIADRSPRQLARRYALWAWAHLAILAMAMVVFRLKNGAG